MSVLMSSSRRRHHSSKKSASRLFAACEALETRRMFVAVSGTAGNDVIDISQSGAMINVKLNGVTTSYGGPITEVRVDALGGNDKVTTSAAITIPVKLYGGDGFDDLTGGSGPDILDGGAGGDILHGMAGNDAIYGMDGDDQCFGGIGNDQIFAGHGNDRVDGEAGADLIYGNGQPDTVIGPIMTASMAKMTTASTTKITTAAVTTSSTPITTLAIVPRLPIGDTSPFFYSDNDVLHGGADGDNILGGKGNDVCYGDSGDDVVYGEDGDDRLYGGYGIDILDGGNNNDVLVTIGGGTLDRAYGRAGLDSFWMDDAPTTELPMDGEPAEFAGSNFHFIKAFEANAIRLNGVTTFETPSKELDGQNLVDPVATNSTGSYRKSPLFGPSGPSKDDIRQGDADDCYFLAGLSAVAKQNPNRIRQSICDLGDGTYVVQLFKIGKMRYYRVDGDLAFNGSRLTYANLGSGGSTWVALMEKAFCYFRYFDGGKYSDIGFGQLEEPFSALALPNFRIHGNNATENLQMLAGRLSLGKAVTIGTPDTAIPLGVPGYVVQRHAYSVDSIDLTAGTVRLRNPWGKDYVDGVATDSNPADGYITLTAAQLYSFSTGAVWSDV